MSEDSRVKWQNAGTQASNMYMKSDEKKETISWNFSCDVTHNQSISNEKIRNTGIRESEGAISKEDSTKLTAASTYCIIMKDLSIEKGKMLRVKDKTHVCNTIRRTQSSLILLHYHGRFTRMNICSTVIIPTDVSGRLLEIPGHSKRSPRSCYCYWKYI